MATQLSGSITVAAQAIHTSSADQYHNGSELVHSSDGRVFRYALAGGTSLVAGQLQQAAAEVTDHQNLTSPVAAAGDTSFAVTLGGTLSAINQYANGWVFVTVTPGVGRQYRISGHAAVAASGSMTVNLSDPIAVALTATSRLDLVRNPYAGVIVNPTTRTSGPVGVAVHPVTNAQYGWVQVGGVTNCLSEGATAVGNFVSASGTTAGAVIDATHVAEPTVGNAMTGIADTEYGAIKLHLV